MSTSITDIQSKRFWFCLWRQKSIMGSLVISSKSQSVPLTIWMTDNTLLLTWLNTTADIPFRKFSTSVIRLFVCPKELTLTCLLISNSRILPIYWPIMKSENNFILNSLFLSADLFSAKADSRLPRKSNFNKNLLIQFIRKSLCFSNGST